MIGAVLAPRLWRCALALLLMAGLAGCAPAGAGLAGGLPPTLPPSPAANAAPAAEAGPAAEAAPSATRAPTATATPTRPAALRMATGPGVAVSDTQSTRAALARRGLDVATGAVDASAADLLLDAAQANGRPAYERIFVPVVRFPAALEGTTSAELRAAWAGGGPSPRIKTLYAPADVVAGLTALWGPPGPAVRVTAPAALPAALWRDPAGLGIAAFDALTPAMRALRLDGLSAVDNRLEVGRWPLAARGWLHPLTPAGAAALAKLAPGPLATNRDPARLTVLAMTGVTALARGTAAAIERAHDDAFPARQIGPELAAADLTTTSNEVSFVENCRAEDKAGLMHFCSRPGYFETLALSGVDLVGLTGNHLNDYGTAALTGTLALYAQHGVRIYGGGADAQAAAAPLIVTDHGNRLAFLGANQFGPAELTTPTGETVSAWAGPHSPGAARYDRAALLAAIRAAQAHADVTLVELQWTEFDAAGDYVVNPLPDQMDDFRALSDAGAAVVTGVQAHAPQALELRGAGVILYGLGNLYFDQTFSWPTRTGVVARHTIYAGRLLNTELLITVIDPNKQVRWATPAERRQVLASLYAASGW